MKATISKRETPVKRRTKPPRRHWKEILRTALAVLILLSSGYLAYTGLHNLPEKNQKGPTAAATPPVVSVSTALAKKTPVEESLAVTGTISSWDELKVCSEISGLHVKAIYIDEGQEVVKGQVLAELNSGLIEAQRAQAEARLKSAQANLVKAIRPNRKEEIAGLRAALAQAESHVLEEKAHMGQAKVNLESAELNVPRYEGLAKLGAVSAVEAETKRFARDTAKLELESATQKVNAAERLADQDKERLLACLRGGRDEDVQINKAAIEEIIAQIKHYDEQIKQTKIRASDDGTILLRNVHIGDTSDLSKPLFIMSRLNRLELRAQVNDLVLHKFKEGQLAKISTKSAEGSKISGRVRLVSPIVDEATRLATVRIEIPKCAALKPGMFVRAEILVSEHEAITIPVSCINTRASESFVFTLKGNKAVHTAVTTGVQNAARVEIVSGLSEGQRVVDKGARFLSDRDVVDLSNDKPAE